MNFVGFFCIIWCGLFLGNAYAETTFLAPASLRSVPDTLSWQVLGSTCTAFQKTPDSLPCHPAFTASDRAGKKIRGHLRFSDHFQNWGETQRIIRGDADRSDLEKVFQEKESSSLQASFEFSYLQENLGLSVQPGRWVYISQIENPSLPLVHLLAYQEQNFRMQLGSFIEGPWSWGVEVRPFRRQVVSQDFFVTDVLVENGSDILKPQTQNGVAIEPGMIYEVQDSSLNPKFSFLLQQWGYLDRKIEGLPLSPKGIFAGSMNPSQIWGDLQLGASLTASSETKSSWDLLQTSVSWTLDYGRAVGQYMLGLSKERQVFASAFLFQGLQTALQYSQEKNLNRVVTFQLGFDF